jgi:hypothetical protein
MSYDGPVRMTTELERVLALPRRVLDFASPEVEALRWSWSPMLLNDYGRQQFDRIALLPPAQRDAEFARWGLNRDLGGENCPLLLSAEQAVSLYEAFHQKGAFIAAGVGFGKTLVSWLLALIFGSPRPLLLVTGGLVDKTHDDFRDLSRCWKAPHRLPDILSFEKLGQPDSDMVLCDCVKCTTVEPAAPGGLRPTHIFADEADKLRNPSAAVTKRVGRYMSRHHDTVYVGMTGTAWRKSIKNAAPQLIWALKWGAPVPLNYVDTTAWSEALDLSTRAAPRDPGALTWLSNVNPKHVETYKERVELAAAGFKNRLLQTPGVVQTQGQSCEQPITIRMLKAPDDPALDAAFQHFRAYAKTLDGWDVDDPLSARKHAAEMSVGFYYFWWNEEGYRKCLEKTRNSALSTISNTERSVLKDCASTTGNGIGMALAVARLKNASRTNAHGTYADATESLLRSMTSYSSDMLGYVTSVVRGAISPEPGKVAALLASTTITKPASFAGCSVDHAIELWACWGIILKVFPALLSIFDEAVQAARPPKEWLEARAAAATFVREKIAESGRRGRPLDSRAPVYREYPNEPCLVRWQQIENDPNGFKPNVVARPITMSVMAFAAAWEKQNGPGLIWVQHDYVGKTLSAMTGIPYFGSKGKDPSGRYIGNYPSTKSAIVSLLANERGRNLQGWYKACVLAPHESNTKWEQAVIGRMHRKGQPRPVFVDVIISCAENMRAVEKAREEVDWCEATVGAENKLLIAEYDWTHFPREELETLPFEHPSRARWNLPKG